MTDLHDVVLDKEKGPTPPAPSALRPVAWALAALVLVAGAAGVYWYGHRSTPSAAGPKPAGGDVQVAAPAHAPLGIETPPVDLPPLDQSDAFVRELMRGLSSHPSVTAWLTTNGLIRNFAVTVDNIATGVTPASHLRVLAPRGPFQIVANGPGIVVNPASYQRYDAVAAAVDGIDPAGAARVYSTLKPRIEDAYRELGGDVSFDVRLEAAIVSLLRVPVVESPALLPRGALYRFADPRLEGLTAAQKQLVRMGPAHVRTVQLALRRIAAALGVPPERLPAAQ